MNTTLKILNGSALILLLSAFFGLPAFSQVTIGTLESPLKGALLDLRQQTETAGALNSTGGLKFPRVSLTGLTSLQPLLSSAEDGAATAAAKLQYKGMTVFNVNVNAGANLQEGLYVWDGTQWELLQAGDVAAAVNASNGLNLSTTNNTVKLGGALTEPTTVDINSNNLLFSRTSGNVGIGVASPKAALHIDPLQSGDPLIVDSVRYTSATNPVDGATPNYYPLQISDKGVVRKSPIVNHSSEKYIYTLRSNRKIATGNNFAQNGTPLNWTLDISNAKDSVTYITLPEDGAYVFSFRLYGTFDFTAGSPTLTGTVLSTSYYISALVNDNTSTSTAPNHDVAEIILPVPNHGPSDSPPYYNKATYAIQLTVAGKAGDKVYFKIGELSGRAMGWTLLSGGNDAANRTSMIFWKI